MLQQCFSTGVPAGDPDAPVTLPGPVLRLLIEAALSNQPFDERAYLLANPDVAEAIKKGKCASGRAHYLGAGYFENRDTGGAGFDEAWYLQRYADVAQAVRSAKAASALHHFRQSGAREGRSPNRTAEADITRWRRALGKVEPAQEKQQTAPVVVPMRAAPVRLISRR
jgi:hypothetical protein